MAGERGGLAAWEAKHRQAAYERIPSTTPDRAAAAGPPAEHRVAMRDGVRLATDVYLPAGEGPFPAILTRLPYGKREPYCFMPAVARHWVRKGYAAAVQDVRGKWASEGSFEPNLNRHEIPDGHDSVAWLAAQPWCDGRVGMWGESYYGFTCYAAAIGGHPALRCIAPGDIGLDRYRATMRGGCLQLNTVGTWAVSMTDRRYQDLSGLDYWHLPLADMAAAAGVPSGYFDALMANPTPSPFWEERSLLAGYEAIRIPVLHWGGWYDTYLGPVVDDWRVMAARNAGAGHQHLFIGPWDHEGTADRCGHVGLLKVAPGTGEARWDAFQAFFDRYLMGAEDGAAPPPVRYYVMGADRWRDAACWPPPGTRSVPLYLASGGAANGAGGDGRLSWQAPQGDQPCDRFDYDPRRPVDATTAIDCWALAGQMGDRRAIEARADVLVYTGAPLDEGLELTGPIRAHLHVATDAPDTDFTCALVDVAPDGAANLIQDGILRCRFRHGPDRLAPMAPHEATAVEIDLWHSSYRLAPGHRLRVEVSSSDFNRYDRNLNTGEAFGRGRVAAVARQCLFHDAARPSFLMLPVHRPGAGEG